MNVWPKVSTPLSPNGPTPAPFHEGVVTMTAAATVYPKRLSKALTKSSTRNIAGPYQCWAKRATLFASSDSRGKTIARHHFNPRHLHWLTQIQLSAQFVRLVHHLRV